MGKPLTSCEGSVVEVPPPLSALDTWGRSFADALSDAEQKPDVDEVAVRIGEEDEKQEASPSLDPGRCWDSVGGLEPQQRRALQRVSLCGVQWKHPSKPLVGSVMFSLCHGGDVDADGNCLFTASKVAMALSEAPSSVRRRTVLCFRSDYASGACPKPGVDSMIRNLYSPDLRTGWGVHVVQELKLLAKKADREALDSAIADLVQSGMIREVAAETIYKERCTAISDGQSWADYMSIAGSPNDEHDIITLQYTQEGLLSVDENRDGRSAAFGDDIAIESLATEYKREIFVVQAHGADAMVNEENCVFFLPHRPRGEVQHPPAFLFMKGTGWCGAGADHYEPLIAQPAASTLQEKAAIVL